MGNFNSLLEVNHATSSGSRLHALIIGIDSYKVKPLSGCENDARAVKDYLVKDLGVPDSGERIRMLINQQAKRSAILQAFSDLRRNGRIKKGDPILIFYAGHGAEIDSPKKWEAGHTKIQAIVPHDYSKDAPVVNCIPDRTLGALIDMLAKEKGDNIVCYSNHCLNNELMHYVLLDRCFRLLPFWLWHASQQR